MGNDIDDWAAQYPQAAAALWQLLTIADASPTTSGLSEAAVSKQTELVAAGAGQRVWRNNSGAYTDDTGRVVRYGLGNVSKRWNDVCKSSDYIGITTVTIGPEHIGQRLGVFTALELKTPGWRLRPSDKRAKAQAAFMALVKQAGGLAMFVTDALEYQRLLQTAGATNVRTDFPRP